MLRRLYLEAVADTSCATAGLEHDNMRRNSTLRNVPPTVTMIRIDHHHWLCTGSPGGSLAETLFQATLDLKSGLLSTAFFSHKLHALHSSCLGCWLVGGLC
eukprot:NODE_3334_length_996_cov_25.684266_g3066_i0.p1 GENE.NODE_3334_length_996_cov_25.684266_g3066_i0~~NODE_3334_length_996_cov_25.684266_g3066_i0.p1  ORF type:complete len:101 (+),score=3.33 NODE_3334_length_996_cov_25.684266_g3066_i0:612-914(+)